MFWDGQACASQILFPLKRPPPTHQVASDEKMVNLLPFDDPKDYDVRLVVVVQDDTSNVRDIIHVHRKVLKEYSGFFGALQSWNTINDTEQPSEVKLHVPCVLLASVRLGIRWMYENEKSLDAISKDITVPDVARLIQFADMYLIDSLLSQCLVSLKCWIHRHPWTWWKLNDVVTMMSLPDVMCKKHVGLQKIQKVLGLHFLTQGNNNTMDAITHNSYEGMLSTPWYVMESITMLGKRSDGVRASISETNLLKLAIDWATIGNGVKCTSQERQTVFDNIRFHSVEPGFVSNLLKEDEKNGFLDENLPEISNCVREKCTPWTWKTSLLCMVGSNDVYNMVFPNKFKSRDNRDSLVYHSLTSHMLLWFFALDSQKPQTLRFMTCGCWFVMCVVRHSSANMKLKMTCCDDGKMVDGYRMTVVVSGMKMGSKKTVVDVTDKCTECTLLDITTESDVWLVINNIIVTMHNGNYNK